MLMTLYYLNHKKKPCTVHELSIDGRNSITSKAKTSHRINLKLSSCDKVFIRSKNTIVERIFLLFEFRDRSYLLNEGIFVLRRRRCSGIKHSSARNLGQMFNKSISSGTQRLSDSLISESMLSEH